MAKAGKKDGEPSSALQVAWSAYEAGDMVLARAAASKVLAAAEPSKADQDAAKKLWKLALGPSGKDDAKAIAADLLARVQGPGQAYVFAAVTAAVYLLMLYLASRA